MTDWRPLVVDSARRGEVAAAIREVVGGLVFPDNMPGQLDRAITRAYLAQHDIVPDPDDAVGDALVGAVNAFAGAPVVPALFGGACGLGWTIEHLAGGETAEEVSATIDRALLDRLATWTDDYDLVSGLVGFGVYGLERGEAGRPLTTLVIDLLERSARPHDGGLAWYTAPELLADWQRGEAPEGYWNYGLAHGLPGVIGLLARCLRFDIEPARVRPLLDGAMTALLAVGPAGFPMWRPSQHESQRRTAWCYGDLGVSFGILAAGTICKRADWLEAALVLARSCAEYDDPTIREASLCHGTAGAMHLFARWWHATGEDVFAAAARRWLARTLANRSTEEAGLIGGPAGVALALHAAITETEPTWDRMLLVDC